MPSSNNPNTPINATPFQGVSDRPVSIDGSMTTSATTVQRREALAGVVGVPENLAAVAARPRSKQQASPTEVGINIHHMAFGRSTVGATTSQELIAHLSGNTSSAAGGFGIHGFSDDFARSYAQEGARESYTSAMLYGGTGDVSDAFRSSYMRGQQVQYMNNMAEAKAHGDMSYQEAASRYRSDYGFDARGENLEAEGIAYGQHMLAKMQGTSQGLLSDLQQARPDLYSEIATEFDRDFSVTTRGAYNVARGFAKTQYDLSNSSMRGSAPQHLDYSDLKHLGDPESYSDPSVQSRVGDRLVIRRQPLEVHDEHLDGGKTNDPHSAVIYDTPDVLAGQAGRVIRADTANKSNMLAQMGAIATLRGADPAGAKEHLFAQYGLGQPPSSDAMGGGGSALAISGGGGGEGANDLEKSLATLAQTVDSTTDALAKMNTTMATGVQGGQGTGSPFYNPFLQLSYDGGGGDPTGGGGGGGGGGDPTQPTGKSSRRGKFTAFAEGMLGRSSVAGDTKGMRTLNVIGGLTKIVGQKLYGAAVQRASASDLQGVLRSEILGFGASAYAAQLDQLQAFGEMAAPVELPMFQAGYTRGKGLQNTYLTNNKVYGDAKTISENLGLGMAESAGLLRDVGSAGGSSLSGSQIAGLTQRGFSAAQVAGFGSTMQLSGTGSVNDALRIMNIGRGLNLSNQGMMQLTQSSVGFASARADQGLGEINASVTARRARSMRQKGEGIQSQFGTLNRFQGVGLQASKGITGFAAGMADTALQAYAMEQSGGDPVLATRLLEDLSGDPVAMRKALSSFNLDDQTVDTMLLGTGQLTTRDLKRGKSADVGDEVGVMGVGAKESGKALKASRATAESSRKQMEAFYSSGGAEKFEALQKQNTKFRQDLLKQMPSAQQISQLKSSLEEGLSGLTELLTRGLRKMGQNVYTSTSKSNVQSNTKRSVTQPHFNTKGF